ncbi:MAG: ABC transporter ATP-binding protein [Deltaproteobacteria bacterium HGW-Deltaproteobacteria-13]|jgi:zinc transport system ATP-binding protein|nr:MAG: ABC transporter ATP-binding protein [Deltaproteobacteria bacterium HGW-Deltaproteobacteria-13]
MSEDIINVDHLTFCYNGLEVISDISFAVKEGDYVGIAGPNGSGKSTLIKNILGILRPQKGCVNIFGRPLTSFHQWSRIGYLPQRISALNNHFPSTVEEIVQLGMKKRNPVTLKRTLDLMGIAHLSTRLIGELSYGEQQRIMLARALISQPDLLIFDEPTTALDPETRDIFYSLTHEMNHQKGTTIVLVTHDTGIIGQYARHLLYLDKKLIFFGTFENFCASPDMAGFFGSTSQHVICHQHEKTENPI